jgi:transketolase
MATVNTESAEPVSSFVRRGGVPMPADERTPIPELRKAARRIRRNIIRMVHAAGAGHPGGSLSAADIVAALYFRVMRIDPARPDWEDRDRFILSKGHACPVWYAALIERGYLPRECLTTLRKVGSPLQGHADMRKARGVDITTGSLGQGLSDGLGMALGARILGKSFRVFVLCGDGEVQEGQIWEAAMAAANWRLTALRWIVERNGLQNDGSLKDIQVVDPLEDKIRAFGWNVVTIDGHDMERVVEALEAPPAADGRPTAIVADTVKGKGVSFMENVAGWHGKAPNAEQAEQALRDIGGEE